MKERGPIARDPLTWAIRQSHPELPDGWAWMRASTDDDGHTTATGAVCPLFKRGPRKGQRNWSKRDRSTERTFIVPKDEFKAARDAARAESAALDLGGTP